MKTASQKFLLFFFCGFLISGSSTFAYSADTTTQNQANQFVRLIQKKLATFPDEKAQKLETLVHTKMIEIQNGLIKKSNKESLQKNALYETIRRQLFTDSFDTTETIFDDGVGAIWNHAPR